MREDEFHVAAIARNNPLHGNFLYKSLLVHGGIFALTLLQGKTEQFDFRWQRYDYLSQECRRKITFGQCCQRAVVVLKFSEFSQQACVCLVFISKDPLAQFCGNDLELCLFLPDLHMLPEEDRG